MSNEILLIRSADRITNSTSSSDFYVKTNTNLQGKYEVLYVLMYNTIYSVNTNVNTNIYFSEGSNNLTAVLPAGSYSTSGSTSIATAVAAAMNAVSTYSNTNYSCTVSLITGLLTITSSGSNNFALTFGTNTANSAAFTLGFPSTNGSSGLSATGTGTSPPYLAGVNSVAINISESTSYSFTTTTGSYGSILVPMDVTFGLLKYYIKDNFAQYLDFSNPVSQLHIKVKGTNNIAITLNGSEFEFAIRKVCY